MHPICGEVGWGHARAATLSRAETVWCDSGHACAARRIATVPFRPADHRPRGAKCPWEVYGTGTVEYARPSSAKLVAFRASRKEWSPRSADHPVTIESSTPSSSAVAPSGATNTGSVVQWCGSYQDSSEPSSTDLFRIVFHCERNRLVVGWATGLDEARARDRAWRCARRLTQSPSFAHPVPYLSVLEGARKGVGWIASLPGSGGVGGWGRRASPDIRTRIDTCGRRRPG